MGSSSTTKINGLSCWPLLRLFVFAELIPLLRIVNTLDEGIARGMVGKTLRAARCVAILEASVRWCNGSTRPFGGFCHGSNPCRTASFPVENDGLSAVTKDPPNIPGHLGDESEQNVKFPKRLRYRGKGKVLCTIYKRADCYRVYWRARVDGKPVSRFKDFGAYAESKREADKIVTGLVKGSQVAALSPGQAA